MTLSKALTVTAPKCCVAQHRPLADIMQATIRALSFKIMAKSSFGENLYSASQSITAGIKNSVKSGLRVGQTAKVLTSTGFDWLRGDRAPAPKVMRQTFEKLGSTYIKLGQFIASSPSLFPDEYVREFQGCLDQVEALPFNYIQATIEAELQQPLDAIFASVDQQPLASASIAQVHAARLLTGEDVVIKVQKPGVQTILLTDFNFLFISAKLLEFFVPTVKRASLSAIVQEIQTTMLEECDFLKEANNIEEFRDFLADTHNTMATAPKVYREHTASKVLTMERFYGVPLTDLDSIRQYTSTPEMTLVTALNTWFSSLTECQFFHADLHAGNLMVLRDGRIGFIDFGIVGRIKPGTWEALVRFMEAQMEQDYRVMAESMAAIGVCDHSVNIERLSRDLKNLIETANKLDSDALMDPFGSEAEINDLMLSMIDVGKTHGIRFPREFALLLKQFLYFDRYIQILSPDLMMFDDDRIKALGSNTIH